MIIDFLNFCKKYKVDKEAYLNQIAELEKQINIGYDYTFSDKKRLVFKIKRLMDEANSELVYFGTIKKRLFGAYRDICNAPYRLQ